jgi:type IV pilus assembly protein PilN
MAFTLNLASRRYINRRLLSRCYGLAVLVLLLGLLALLGNSWLRVSETSRYRRQLAELQKAAAREGTDKEKPPSAAELARVEKQLTFARNILQQDRFRWTLLLSRLEELAIEGVRISTIQPDYQDGSLRLTALAWDDRKMRDFLDRLLTSEDFSNVFLLEQTRLEVKDANNRPRSALGFTVVLKGAF